MGFFCLCFILYFGLDFIGNVLTEILDEIKKFNNRSES